MDYYSRFQEDVVASATPPENPLKDQLWWKLPEQTLWIWDGELWILNRAVSADDPSKAPIDSPHFTGVPTVPLAPSHDNTDQIASTAYVKLALDNDLVDWTQVLNKPGTFPPTLPILQSDVSGLVVELGLRAPINNPIFTGNPQLSSTPPTSDDDLSIATTAFVKNAIGAGYPGGTINQYLRGDKTWQTLDKIAVGLANVDNTADSAKPVSTPQNAADLLRVLKTGDTMTGALAISMSSGAANISISGLSGQNAGIVLSKNVSTSILSIEGRLGSIPRWQFYLGDGSAESGVASESAGSNISLRRFRNDGVYLGESFNISRATGIVDFLISPTAPTLTVGDSTTKLATTAFVTGSIGAKEPVISFGSTNQYWRGDKTWTLLDKTVVGLANVDNTSDLNKPISNAEQAQLNLKAPLASPIFTGKITTPAPTTGSAGIILPHGAAPTIPSNGDLWSTSAGFFGQVNGVTVGPFGAPLSGPQGIQGPKGDKGDKGDIGGQIMYVGDAPPASPVAGQTWFESDTGNSFIYYYDGNSYQWVPTSIGPLPDAVTVPVGEAPADGKTYGRKNLTWQEVTGGTGGATAWADITGKPATFPPTVPIAQSDITGLVAAQTAQDTAIGLKLNASAYTAADVLAKLVTVDGNGSNLDADFFDGESSTYYLNLANMTGTLPAARFDDTSHGARAGGTLHANVIAAGSAGFMTGADKTKLDGIATSANNYVHPLGDGNLHVPATGAGSNGMVLKAGSTAGSGAWTSLTKSDVGLANVDNTTDLNKPISTATQTALDAKEPSLPTGGTTSNYLRGDKTWQLIETGGLSLSYEYTFDPGLTEPVSSANVKFNAATSAATTKIWVHDISSLGKDNGNIFTLFSTGDRLYFQDKDDSSKWASFSLTGPTVDKGVYTEFPVAWINGAGTMPAQRIVFIVEGKGSSNAFDQVTADNLYVNMTGDTMTGPLILNANPVANLGAATKQYVDLNAASTVVGDTPPATPTQGKLWFDSASGQLYVRYDDGSSAQWVIAVNNTPDLSSYATNVSVAGTINRVVTQSFISLTPTPYVPSPGTQYVTFETVGGGGGGGGTVNSAAGNKQGAGGGAGGNYSKITVPVASAIGLTMTVGAGGPGANPGPNNGSNGGTTSVGGICTAPGGGGGGGCATAGAIGGVGIAGAFGVGDLALRGGIGVPGYYASTTTPAWGGGGGGNSAMGFGSGASSIVGGTVVGQPGIAYGGGGSGGCSSNALGNAGGGNGAQGIIVITEYIH